MTPTARPHEVLAFAKAVKDKALDAARESLAPGVHQVDVLVRVHGAITVAEDYEQRVAAAVPWPRLAAVLLSKLNGATIESVVAEALALDEARETAVKEQAKEAIERLVDATKRTCKGKVTTAIAVDVVQRGVASL